MRVCLTGFVCGFCMAQGWSKTVCMCVRVLATPRRMCMDRAARTCGLATHRRATGPVLGARPCVRACVTLQGQEGQKALATLHSAYICLWVHLHILVLTIFLEIH